MVDRNTRITTGSLVINQGGTGNQGSTPYSQQRVFCVCVRKRCNKRDTKSHGSTSSIAATTATAAANAAEQSSVVRRSRNRSSSHQHQHHQHVHQLAACASVSQQRWWWHVEPAPPRQSAPFVQWWPPGLRNVRLGISWPIWPSIQVSTVPGPAAQTSRSTGSTSAQGLSLATGIPRASPAEHNP